MGSPHKARRWHVGPARKDLRECSPPDELVWKAFLLADYALQIRAMGSIILLLQSHGLTLVGVSTNMPIHGCIFVSGYMSLQLAQMLNGLASADLVAFV